ncbi:hypothetical protein [Clostridium sp. AM58-1XD]|uniref:hypothetical protein n=1 Tax=Clostridium sp. AM58-1XD TaxID=2292307 RepID=UPI0015F4A29E|nr:hypothetical protein [Clostridium sp. AM58-1XD]
MIRNNVRIWDGIYNEVIADDMVLHEFGFEIPVPIYGSGNDCNKIKKILEG